MQGLGSTSVKTPTGEIKLTNIKYVPSFHKKLMLVGTVVIIGSINIAIIGSINIASQVVKAWNFFHAIQPYKLQSPKTGYT
jgi:hypothetical protein